METLKKIFSLKKNGQNKEDWKTDKEDREQIRITYYQSGFAASQKAMGKALVFKACLENVYNSFENQCRKQLVEQKRLKQPYVEEKVRQSTELKKLETTKTIYEEQDKELEQKVETAHSDIRNVKQKPENYGLEVDKRPKMQLYIGLAVLIPITIYLLVFYISVSYSAFFKEFSENSLTAAIFDFVMKEHENLDKINVFIKAKKEEIKNIELQKSKISEKIKEVIQKITSIQGKIDELQSKLDGFIFPVKEYLHYHHQYKEGWFQSINTEIALPSKQKNELLESCEVAWKEHLNRLNLNEMDHQHVVYSTIN